jgi:integrase
MKDRVTGVVTRGQINVGPPKSERSRRTLRLPAFVKTALLAQRSRQSELRLRLGPAWEGTGYVFTSGIGTPCEYSNVRSAFKTLLEKAGLPTSAKLHGLRHSCASIMLEAGVDLKTISDTLGHSSIGITLDLYSHVAPRLKEQAANLVDQALTKVS